MHKPAKWRGKPNATQYDEFYRLLQKIKPKKTDVFYDLGCGYGNTCKWISKQVGLAVGIENYSPYYFQALKNINSKKLTNVKIIKKNFEKISFKNATIIYTLMDLPISVYRQINRIKNKVLIIEYGFPIYPIKSQRFGPYFVYSTPFNRVKDENEFAQIFMSKKKSTINDMSKSIGRYETKKLKWYISREKSIWDKINIKNS